MGHHLSQLVDIRVFALRLYYMGDSAEAYYLPVSVSSHRPLCRGFGGHTICLQSRCT